MSTLPEPNRSTATAIHLLHAVKAAAEEDRVYLGWSEIGHECERYLWQRWRWVGREVLQGRIARLFDTGHREEARVLDELRALGCKVEGQQFEVSSVGGHLRGHMDAIVQGLPEAPKTWHLVDVKTVNAKKFKEIVKKSMKVIYPKYWAQAHGYMGRAKLERAAFIFVCKDDDQIHVERVEYDPAVMEQYEARAARIVRASEPPPRLSDDPEDNECKYCTFRTHCHGSEAPRTNCRTCAHSTPVLAGDDGAWRCDLRSIAIDTDAQRQGCDQHRFIPILLERFASPVATEGDAVRYALSDGREFTNGAPPAGLASKEISACADKAFLPHAADPDIALRTAGARICA